MRCKKHYTDQTSLIGVCASCLRERLFCIITAQEQSNLNSDAHQLFPRSVSPYICKRKTDNSDSLSNNQRNSDRIRHHTQHTLPDRRFFSTPQVTFTAGNDNRCRKKHNSFVFASMISNLFRSKKRNEDINPRSSNFVSNLFRSKKQNDDSNSNPRSSVSVSNYRGSCGGDDSVTVTSVTSVMSSPFWFSNNKSGGGCRKKKPICSAVTRKQYCSDRGMSPVRRSDCDGVELEGDFCDRASGYETSESRKQTPWTTPARSAVRHGGDGGHRKNVSGISFCLSPLVRTSPCRRHWSYKGVVAPVDAGDMRSPVKFHLANTKGLCANRSRKVADFGRIDMNR